MIVVERYNLETGEYIIEEAEGDLVQKEATFREKSVLEFIAFLKKNEHQTYNLVHEHGWIRWREEK